MRNLMLVLVVLSVSMPAALLADEAAAARAELDRRGIEFTEWAFLDAAKSGNLEVVRLFVAAGMSVNTATERGVTALHFAAYNGHLSVVQYLVGAGADLEATGKGKGRMEFHWTAGGDHELVQSLFDALTAASNDRWTALHFAAQAGHLAVVEFLVGAGADLEATSNNRWTALHWAAIEGHLAVVKYLVGQGLSVTATDNNGKKPRDLAEDEGHGAVVNYLDSL